VRRQSESVALGYVTARVVECTFILLGLMSVISLVSVSDAFAGGYGGRSHRAQRAGKLAGGYL
jgi:hypothetical protein